MAITLYGPTFQWASANDQIGNSTVADPTTPATPEGGTGLGYCDFARHYFRNRGFFLFLQVLRWFTSLGSLTPAYVFSRVFLRFAQVGFPIRRSPDITPVCGSPELIAACHVLHRLFLPRHPPCALSSLTIELIPRRKRSCCLMPDHSMHISACAPREVRAPLTHEFLKTLNLNNAALSTCERAGLLSLVCIYPMQFVVKEQNAAKEQRAP